MLSQHLTPSEIVTNACGANRAFECIDLQWSPNVASDVFSALQTAAKDERLNLQELAANSSTFDLVRIRAARSLRKNKKWAALAHLTRAYGASEDCLVLHLDSLVAAGATEDFVALDRQLLPVIETIFEETEAKLARARRALKVPMPTRVYRAYLDDIPSSIEVAIQNIRPHCASRDINRLAEGVRILRSHFGKGFTTEDRDHFLWGIRVCKFVKFLDHYSDKSNIYAHPKHAAIASLKEQLNTHYQIPGLENFLYDQSTGRSIVLNAFHAGLSNGVKPIIDAVSLPSITITRYGHTDLDERSYNKKLGLRGNAQASKDFLRLIKIARKSQHLMVIFPDGPDGADKIERLIGPVKIEIAQGAPSLAWNTKALPWFFRSEISLNGDISLRLSRGPDPYDFDDRDEYIDTYLNAITSQWQEIAMGPPQNIGRTSGFWTYVKRLSIQR